jgi:hypothetical protein
LRGLREVASDIIDGVFAEVSSAFEYVVEGVEDLLWDIYDVLTG